MILMIDNYDSFTYNLVQYLRMLSADVAVIRNDDRTVAEVCGMTPSHLVISPGPGRPAEAGISMELIRALSGKIPILGVCLGHQAIAEAFGGKVDLAKSIMHGKTSAVTTDGKTIFEGIPSPFDAMRYHSLAVVRETMPDCLEITAETADGEIMGIRHRTHPTEGIQFHPESIMTPKGKRIIKNFLRLTV
ncbi:MAG: aminodeoxychorismate/anthranilate synthase component II [Thermodesulfobacteriota bacterium]